MRGFTLIELMVVLTVIAILIVVAVPSYNNYNNNQKLADAANQLQAILRQAQNNAQTGTLCNDGSKSDYWHVDLTKGANSYSFTSSCSSQPIQSTTLPSEVTVSDIHLKETGIDCSASNAQVQYKNISSEVNLVTSDCPDTPNKHLEITLSLPDSSNRIVMVEKGGGIYVNSVTPTPTPSCSNPLSCTGIGQGNCCSGYTCSTDPNPGSGYGVCQPNM